MKMENPSIKKFSGDSLPLIGNLRAKFLDFSIKIEGITCPNMNYKVPVYCFGYTSTRQ